jgi:hypothetical protein
MSICISSIKMSILALDRVQLHLKGAVNSWDYTGMLPIFIRNNQINGSILS